MIDGIKSLCVKTDAELLLNNSILKKFWKMEVQTQTGAVCKDYVNYKGLQFIHKQGLIQLRGSIHKYFNSGLYNFDDFYCINCINTIKELGCDFEIDLNQTEIHNLEFGVNISLPFKVALLLENLLTYKGNCFEKKVEDTIDYYEAKMSQFNIKLYDKGKQNRLPHNLLRFEIKVKKKQYFERYNLPINSLSDLLNSNIYPKLAEILVLTFNEILFGDNRIEVSSLSIIEKAVFFKGSNINTWIGKSENEKMKKQRQRFKKNFFELLKDHRVGINFQEIAMQSILKKSLKVSQLYLSDNSEISNIKSSINVPNLHFKYMVETGQIS
ncbi:hypothetical protein [Emticicia sp. C21]|uniref:hypothetical protein n=1 Tax=Emticicia sp. C21 TaxID=2302915 RepID=UPI000E3516FD|nr:hypothetical protein [Emticicia sp. C21]RFS17360.1 hypothetical protein D0T08_06160 [Emticicia sp. C21]